MSIQCRKSFRACVAGLPSGLYYTLYEWYPLLANFKEEEQYSIDEETQDMHHKNGLIIAHERVQRSETAIFGTTGY